ncbi:hypothetical protein [Streptomyces sp. H39-C1]|uniref:hypothetical protein n=1 Tax=Streptomyces sp. H39-C1 TaxID=3004355 RepID=UPI0022AF76F9|nr:hypothetical protein [Streptomyces sp. H39-C1]MCZ4103718.1 hypothetical protein [Streptomyces sp. H39-C1]
MSRQTAADHRAHLALDWAARHGPVSGPLAMASTSLAVATTGSLAGLPSGWPLVVGAVGAAAHGIGAGRRKRLSRPSLATRAAGWLLSSGWTSAVIATDPSTWSGRDAWTALATLAAITIGVGGAAYASEVHEEAADDARRALEAAMAEAHINRADWKTIDAWMALVRQVTRVGVEFAGYTPRANGSGFALEISLPIGVTSDRIAAYAQALAEAARLPTGCLVRIERASRQGHVIADVDTRDTSSLTVMFPVHDAGQPLTVNGPLPFVVDRSGDPISLAMREACMLVIGPPGSAKSTLLDGIVGTLARCPDVLVWGMDRGKGCADLKHWNVPWLQATGRIQPKAGQTRPPKDTVPVVDWLAPTLAEAETMLDAMLAIGDKRLQYADNTKLLTVSPAMPMIIGILDEGAEMLAYQGNDPLQNRVRTKIVTVIRTLRAMGIRLILTATDGNLSSIGDSAIRKYSPARIALTATDAEGSSVAKLFGRVNGIDIRQLRSKGSGVVGLVTGDPDTEIRPTAMRTYKTDDCNLYHEVAVRTRAFRTTLESAALEVAGSSYAERWSDSNIQRLWSIAQGEEATAETNTRKVGGLEIRRTLNLPSRPADNESATEQPTGETTPQKPDSGPITDADLSKFLTALGSLPEAKEPAPREPEADTGPTWLPEIVEAIKARGVEGMKVGEVAQIVGLDRRTVRAALRDCPELMYRSNGPHSCYVHRDHDDN